MRSLSPAPPGFWLHTLTLSGSGLLFAAVLQTPIAASIVIAAPGCSLQAPAHSILFRI
jgi:hypothetical protein